MGSGQIKREVLVVHGPNLNMLGQREPEIYGHTRLEDVDSQLVHLGKRWGMNVNTFQSNGEGAIVDALQEAVGKAEGLIINPGAYTHTSVAIRDALVGLNIPSIEVHLSNIHKRESFRHTSLITDVVNGQILGLGINGYYLALRALADIIGAAKATQ